MQNVVTSALRSLLMEEGRVCLPGIGTLMVVQQPAVVSLIEGKASAPAARVSFNVNLVVDDGRLRREIGPDALERFLEHVRENLAAGRPLVLEGVGKIYRQADGEIRFTAAGDNFSKDTYGLPPIDVRPIIRKEKGTPPGPPPPRKPALATATHSRPGKRAMIWLWYAAALVGLLLVIFLLFRLGGTIGSELASRPKPEPPAARVNISPSRPGSEPIRADRIEPEPPPRLNERPDTSPAVIPPPAAATENVAIIAIGLYGRQRNVEKQTRRLREAGYEPYTDREGRNTRVGVEVRYREQSELDRVLAEVRARYEEQAYIMRVNGEERRPE